MHLTAAPSSAAAGCWFRPATTSPAPSRSGRIRRPAGAWRHPVPGLEGIPTVRNFRFSNVRVHEVPVLLDGTSVHPDRPLEGFTLEGVTGTALKGISLANVRGAKLRDIKITGYTGPLIGINNVTGTGLKGAAAIPAPQPPSPCPPRRDPSGYAEGARRPAILFRPRNCDT